MKTLAFALLLSLPVPRLSPSQLRQPQHHAPLVTADHRGRWYLAQTGHAVYCYGPVVTLPAADNGLKKVATFCRGNDPVVPLKE
jgi:hypothetical protein